jgi:ATP-dependent Clp endopeptidase proteolytic subunit ClpP
MADETVRQEYDDDSQRRAVCEAQWARMSGGQRNVAAPASNAVRPNGELVMYGIIGDEMDALDSQTLMAQIDAMELAEGEPLVVRLNSPGGYIADGLAVYNLLRARSNPVEVHIDGVAASMASVIAMAGDRIVMPDNAVMMIHNPWNAAMGDAATMRKAAEQLDVFKDALIGIYAGRTGVERDRVSEMMDEETWMRADEAVSMGFADEIVESVAAAALHRFDLNKHFTSPPSDLGGEQGGSAARQVAEASAEQTSKEDTMTKQTQGSAEATRAERQAETQTATAGGASGKTNTAEPQKDAETIRKEAVAAERERASKIRNQVAKASLPTDFADKLIDEGVSTADANARIVDKLAEQDEQTPTNNHVRVIPGEDERTKWMKGAQNAIIARAGKSKMVGDATGEKIEPGEFRGMTMLDLARDCLDRAGVKHRGLSKMELMGRALTLPPVNAAPYQTTGDFSTLLENTMHKVLQAAYDNTPDTWSRFCATGSVSDFRPHNRYRMGMFSRLDSLTESGEFKNKPINDAEKEVMQAGTYGNIISLSRQALISDDLSSFDRLATMLGRAARLSVEVDVYALFAENGGSGPTMNDGKAFFHSDHNNLAGTTGAPSVDTFDSVRTTMASQRDPWDGDYLDIRPSIWVGPLGLGGEARVVNDARYDPSDADTLQKPNQVRGLFQDIVDTPRLTGTPWYAFADPAQVPAFEVAFLEGETQPFLESDEGWRVDGVEWKVRHDYGVAAIDYRGAVKNTG